MTTHNGKSQSVVCNLVANALIPTMKSMTARMKILKVLKDIPQMLNDILRLYLGSRLVTQRCWGGPYATHFAVLQLLHLTL
jgi:hypothetical protein